MDIADAAHGSSRTEAQTFTDLFRETYLRFHRRDGKRSELSGASRAVLQHLSQAGPLTIGELSDHLDRAQSVVSDIIAGLEDKGLLERDFDPADRRRRLVWLSEAGFELLQADRNVLGTDLLAAALSTLSAGQRAALFDGLRALIAAQPNPHL